MIDVLDQAGIPELEEQAGTTVERSSLYGFLAVVFRAEPTPELLAEIRRDSFRAALKAVDSGLADSLAGVSEQKLLDDLAVEYTHLFIGPGNHVAPYATLFLGGNNASLWGPETVWVKRFIEDAGFEYSTDFQDLPDHIAVELEFMQQLTANEAAAIESGDRDRAEILQAIEKEFVTAHMAKWIPDFCRKVQDRAEFPFYRDMAGLTEGFILSEAAMFGAGENTA
ncbi:MAG: hypothetical protein HN377_08460 [Alphaproteobacteria bacterium]|nr:hypothetical protein [Alphaproteobacteria bacterium]MBT7941796.1 hypothetical protein [Alphaproteobacteria bacterium]